MKLISTLLYRGMINTHFSSNNEKLWWFFQVLPATRKKTKLCGIFRCVVSLSDVSDVLTASIIRAMSIAKYPTVLSSSGI